MTVTLGILALLEAGAGKGDELAAFLTAGRDLAVAGEGTVTSRAQVTGSAGEAGLAWVSAVPALRRALGDDWRNCRRQDPCAGSAECH